MYLGEAWEGVGGRGIAASLRCLLLLVSVERLGSNRFDLGSGLGYGPAAWMRPVVPLVDQAVAFWANGVMVLSKVRRWDSTEPCAAAVQVQVFFGSSEGGPVLVATVQD